MNKIISAFLALCCMASFSSIYGEELQQSRINWLTNYEEATNLSKQSSKPIILFFTGSDWCGWCTRLEEEVFSTPDFAREAGGKYIFLKLDFPMNTSLPPQLTAQNKQLQKKFDVRSYPTIIILDSQQQKIGVTGYRPGGGKQYAQHLEKMVKDYSAYSNHMQNLDEKFSVEDLKRLYEKANQLERYNDANLIVRAGMKLEDKEALFFLIERYRFLADEGQISDKEAVALKQRLLALDPKNEQMTHYQVAVIDFQAYCEEMGREKYSPKIAVAPLVSYIETFGKQDKENLWRLHMIISQVYFDKNNLLEALKYAQHSYDSAPTSAQPEIAIAIKNIQSKVSASTKK